MTATDQLQGRLDKLTLTALVSILSAAVDRGDRDKVIDCYAPESYDDHGALKGSGREFAEMICAPAPLGRLMTMHHLIEGRTASGFGRYVDHFRRIDDGWKLVYRRVVPNATMPVENK